MNVSSQASWAMKESEEAAEEESSQRFSVCQKQEWWRRGLRHDIYEHVLTRDRVYVAVNMLPSSFDWTSIGTLENCF
jgi:hypothetical protein